VLIERDPAFRFAPSLLWVMTGARRPAQITRDLRRLRAEGIEVLDAEVTAIDPTNRSVTTTTGTVTADALVVALGAALDPDAVPGFGDAAHNLYTLDGAMAAGDALQSIHSGSVAVVVSSTPFKCPAAPYEAAFLADSLLRRRGVRDHVHVDIYSPEPLPMPTAGATVGDALVELLHARGIGFHPGHSIHRIDHGTTMLTFSDGTEADADVVLGVPVHRPPAVVTASGLAGDAGYIPVDPHTLATVTPGVHAIGDVTAITIAGGKMLPKAGVFAEAEAEVVAKRIADEWRGRQPSATFAGSGACFVELGQGASAYASGDFYAADGPAVRMRRPGRRWHFAKVAFEQYWLRRWL
jgi:sulfide:quinone oxidoreductase